jgi:amidase
MMPVSSAHVCASQRRGLRSGCLIAAFICVVVMPVSSRAVQDTQPAAVDTLQLEECDIATLQSLMKRGDLTAEQLTQHYLDRIAALDDAGPEINAILEINPDALEIARALDEEKLQQRPRGPMHGIPVVLKANIDTGDELTTTAGSLALAGYRAGRDAFVVARLRDAGAVILGKANLSEWANFRSERSTSGWSSLGRQTRNPYVLDRNPCGSSSGSAVAVAAGFTAVSVGTETDGSIVCPSGTNGIVAIKPTLGLVSRDGIIPIAHSQDTAGPMARSVKDAATLLTAMVAQDPNDPAAAGFPQETPDYLGALRGGDLHGVRIGVMRDYSGAGANAEVEARLEEAIGVLESLGAEVIDPVQLGAPERMYEAEYEVLLYEFKADLDDYLLKHGAPNGMRTLEDIIAFDASHRTDVMPYFGQEVFLAAQEKGPLSDAEYKQAAADSKPVAQQVIDQALEENQLDAIIAPTNGPAWVTDLVNGDHFSVSSSTLPAVSGYPSVTVPMGNVYGLPVGLSFFGTAYSEPVLLRIAYSFEQSTGSRKPPGFLPTLGLE